MIRSISWKNIWRSKTRSIIVILAITFGLWGGIFSVGMMGGLINQRIHSAINYEVSHIQIHNKKYLENNEPAYTIDNVNEMLKYIENLPEVAGVSKRFKIQALSSVSGRQAGGYILGVESEREKLVSQLYTKLKDTTGTYLDEENVKTAFIGEKLARSLSLVTYKIDSVRINMLRAMEIEDDIIEQIESIEEKDFRTEAKMKNAIIDKIGYDAYEKNEFKIRNALAEYKSRKKIVFKMQGADNHNVSIARRVCGIYKTSNSMYDVMNVFVDYHKLAEETGFNEDQAHEVVIMAKDIESVDMIADTLKEKYPEYDIKTWKEIQPELAMTTDYMMIMFYFIIFFILFALAFGIINTMLMAVLERTKELGMLMAVGMNRTKVFLMIMLETVMLSLTGGVVGMFFGWLTIAITNNTGIDLTSVGDGFESVGYDAIIYPEIGLGFYIGVTVLVILTGILSAVYPARKALKLKPVEALRTV